MPVISVEYGDIYRQMTVDGNVHLFKSKRNKPSVCSIILGEDGEIEKFSVITPKRQRLESVEISTHLERAIVKVVKMKMTRMMRMKMKEMKRTKKNTMRIQKDKMIMKKFTNYQTIYLN